MSINSDKDIENILHGICDLTLPKSECMKHISLLQSQFYQIQVLTHLGTCHGL